MGAAVGGTPPLPDRRRDSSGKFKGGSPLQLRLFLIPPPPPRPDRKQEGGGGGRRKGGEGSIQEVGSLFLVSGREIWREKRGKKWRGGGHFSFLKVDID